jgi:hypothetical protein
MTSWSMFEVLAHAVMVRASLWQVLKHFCLLASMTQPSDCARLSCNTLVGR